MLIEKECIPVGCLPPTLYHTVQRPPRQRPSWTGAPPDRDPRGQTNTCENITCANFVFGAIKMTLWYLKSICKDWYYIWVPTRTEKMGRHFPVREFWTDWKSQGKSQNTRKVREFQTKVLEHCYLLFLVILKWTLNVLFAKLDQVLS